MRKRTSFVSGFKFKNDGVAQCVFQDVGTDYWNIFATMVGEAIGIDKDTVIDSGILLGKVDDDFPHESAGRNIHIYLLGLAFNYAAIANFLGVSRERIRQICNHVAGHLEQRLDNKKKINAFWAGFHPNPKDITAMPSHSNLAVILAQLSSMSGYQEFEKIDDHLVNSTVMRDIRNGCKSLIEKAEFDNAKTGDMLSVINIRFAPNVLKSASTGDLAAYYLLKRYGIHAIESKNKLILIHQGIVNSIIRRIGRIRWCSVEFIERDFLYHQAITRWHPKWKSRAKNTMTIDVFMEVIKNIVGCNIIHVDETGESLVDLRNVDPVSPASAEVIVMDAIANGAISAGNVIDFVGNLFSSPAVSIVLASSPIIIKRGRNHYGVLNEN